VVFAFWVFPKAAKVRHEFVSAFHASITIFKNSIHGLTPLAISSQRSAPATQINNLRHTAHCSPLTAHLLSAVCPLPSAFRTLADSADSVSNADAGPIAITFAHAAAEPSSMGRGDFVSRLAI
jgi:hypothetical protein